ncbi:unnamed protein product [Citrullus colocynthis]|uniref:Uncharacterized protein n=1 Tax=Citrullus colocynthis TaxID=252529 RepID=A0ABP0XNM6_9ROSI
MGRTGGGDRPTSGDRNQGFSFTLELGLTSLYTPRRLRWIPSFSNNHKGAACEFEESVGSGVQRPTILASLQQSLVGAEVSRVVIPPLPPSRKEVFGRGSFTCVGVYGNGTVVHGSSTATPKVAHSCGQRVEQ